MIEELKVIKGIVSKYVPANLMVGAIIIFAIIGLLSFINDYRKSFWEIKDLKQQMKLRALEIDEKIAEKTGQPEDAAQP